MKVIIRTDSSVTIGSGHLMRCLTLADQLRTRGGSVSFISRDLSGNVSHLAEKKGYPVHRLASPEKTVKRVDEIAHAGWLKVDWRTDAEETKQVLRKAEQPFDVLIVDHYALDKRWEMPMRPFVSKIMVIDDIADRPHDCDVLLDQNLYLDMGTRYDGLVPATCIQLLGPSYVLLRPEFSEARRTLRKRDGSVQRVLIFFGGSDPMNETVKALDAVRMLNRPDIVADIVVGGANPHKEQIRQECAKMPNAIFHCQVENMEALMAQADLSIGAGGSASWERCFLGLPTITISVADNQIATTQALARQGATIYLGKEQETDREKIMIMLSQVIADPERLLAISRMAFDIVGKEPTGVLDAIVGLVS